MAFVHEDDCWSVARLTAAVERLAAGLTEVGVRSGDRVALHLRTGPEIATAYLACFRIGAIAAPLNLRFKQTELELVLHRLSARLYLGQRDLYRNVAGIDDAILPAGARFLVDGDEELAARSWARLHSHNTDTGAQYEAEPDAPAALLTTSGTTGEPKLVAHSLGTLTATADRFRHFGMRAGSKAAFFLPMVHMSGLSVFLAGLRLGVRLVMCDANDPAGVLDAVERHGLDCVFALPAAASALIEAQRQQPRNVSSLTMAFTAGDVPPAGQQQAWEEAFGCKLGSFWAATEATGSFSPGAAPGPWSRPVPGAELRVVGRDGADARRGEVGEMLLRGTNVMLGYWRLPGVLTGLEDGWYRTGDLVCIESGGVRFVARIKDLIVRGGSNISPVEVEQVLGSHPAVVEVAVAGVHDPVLGQRVMALVRLKTDATQKMLSDVLASAVPRLADYKLPECLFATQTLPRNATGKIDRQQVSAMLEERFAARSAEGASAQSVRP